MKKSLLIFTTLGVLLCLTGITNAQNGNQPIKAHSGTLTYLGETSPLAEMEPFPNPIPKKTENNPELKNREYPFAESALPQGPDEAVQDWMGGKSTGKGLTINFDGMQNTGFPPDPNGDVGPNHYFQTVNTNYQIFDKAGTSLYGPADIRNIWSTTQAVSDPVVLYDENADRWFVEIFSKYSPFNMFLAVSTTANPLGSYHIYTLSGLPGYPDFTKFGVWRDGYYAAANYGSSNDIWAFDRSSMLSGLSTSYVDFDNPWRPNSGFHCIMPFDNDGGFAPYGSPGQFITINDDAWGGSDQLWIYELDVNWSSPGSATFTRTQQLAVTSFDSNFGPSWDNIYQQGTAQRLDAVPQVLNYRAQYRNFGSYQSIVCNHSVDVDNTDHAGVRWYELRKTTGNWYIYQQSTYAPDAHSRWMGAININAYGDIGLAYSVSSTSMHPSLRYTGRHVNDPINTMTFAEQSILESAYSQTGGNRWGDYFSMSVDPSDDRTFWFTGEYRGSNLRTRIAAINFGVYCAASGGCDEYISNVQVGSINNSSLCTEYADFTSQSTDVPLNSPQLLTITNGNPYPGDQCGVWVDWNRDGDFYDANEGIAVSGTPGYGPYTASILPPSGMTTGPCTMRIRITYTGTLSSCGITTYGEVEDYTLNVTPNVPVVWTGAISSSWHNSGNWSPAVVPDATMDVTINDAANKCWVYTATASCKNITINTGSWYTLRVYDSELHVYGNMDVYGMLLMDNSAGVITAEGDVSWNSGSSMDIQANTVFWVNGDWNFNAGANVQLNNGIVDFTGTGYSYIRCYESNCYFNNIGVYKGGGDYAACSGLSTADMNVHGSFYIQPNKSFYSYSGHSVNFQGNVYNAGELIFNSGTLTFNGGSQTLSDNLSYTTTTEFNNLTLNNTSLSIPNKAVTINGDVTIVSGHFTTGQTMFVGGNWDNQTGSPGFTGAGSVDFNGGNYHQYCSDETFNNLVLDKSLGGALRMDGTSVVCASYDWTAGAIDVLPGGSSFTALDLVDNGIYGAYYLNPGGTINLTNADGYVDLDGELHIFGGTMNVFGGNTTCYLTWGGDALLSMSGGILDFHDQGIYAYNSTTYTLTEDITGGLIRTTGGFWLEDPAFTPDFGTMEFYGTADATIYTNNTGYLHDVVINKTTKKSPGINKPFQSAQTQASLIDERSGMKIGDGINSNTLTLTGWLDINGSLLIDNGILNSNGNDIHTEGNWTNNVGDAGFIETTAWVYLDGSGSADILTNETFANLYIDKTYTSYDGLEIMDGLTVNVINDLSIHDGTIEMNYASILKVGGILFISVDAGLNANDGLNEIEVRGNWVDPNVTHTIYVGFDGAGEVVTFNGNVDQFIGTNAPQVDISNLIIDKTAGYFRPQSNLNISGGLQILNGDWWDNNSGLTHSFLWNVFIQTTGGYYPQGTTTFGGGTYQTYENNGGSALFHDVIIDKTLVDNIPNGEIESDQPEFIPKETKAPEGVVLDLLSSMVIFSGNTFTLQNGDVNLNGHNLKSTGDININGGSLNVDAGSWLSVGTGVYVNSGGTINLIGLAGNKAHVHNDASSFYIFDINNGGTIGANNATFQDLGFNGVCVINGATVDPLNSFSYCDFLASSTDPYSIRLIIDNTQTLTLDHITFQDNPSAPFLYNIGKLQDQGLITISNTSGDFTSPLYEYDSYDRINWTEYVHGEWTGLVSSDWFDPMNWGDFVVPDATVDVNIPAGTPNSPLVNNALAYANNLSIQAGATLEIGNNELHISNTTDIYGELIMTNAAGKLFTPAIDWQPGSTSNVLAGEIHNSDWTWEDGTNANLGTGNTAFIDFGISPFDADAAFGNLVVTTSAIKGNKQITAVYPLRVSGDCLMEAGIFWSSSVDVIVNGMWEIQNGAAFTLNNATNSICGSDMTLNGELDLTFGDALTVHGNFIFGPTGILNITDGSFTCDYTLPSGFIDLQGVINLDVGLVDFPNANVMISGSVSQTGGTLRVGRTLVATVIGSYTPTGGILELSGTSGGHYIQFANGNFINNFNVNRSASIGIHPGSPLHVMGTMDVNSGLNLQGNTLTADGDVNINYMGGLSLTSNSRLEMGAGTGIYINNGGLLDIDALPGNEAVIGHSGVGYYDFQVMNGGVVSCEYGIFEYMNANGINMLAGSSVDPTHAFNNSVFRNGMAGGQLLKINNTQNFTVNNADFPNNTWGGLYNVNKLNNTGNVIFVVATGGFSGPVFESDPFNLVDWIGAGFTLDLTVYLEGAFNGTGMDAGLNTILPLNQPFNPALPYMGNPLPDWYYSGAESVPFIPNANVVDWVLVDARDATTVATATPATSIARKVAFLLNNGSVVDIDGSSNLAFGNTIVNNLYVAVWHRNHLGVISANPLTYVLGVYSYDFSSGSGQSYGGSSAQKNLGGTGIWGMMSGDGNGDGNILTTDKTNVWDIQTGTSGFLPADYNMNSEVNNPDKNNYWLPNLGKGSFIPE